MPSYRDKRYLEHIPLPELEQRARDLAMNLTEVTPEGTLAVRPSDDAAAWWAKWRDLLEEYELRGVSRNPAPLDGLTPPTRVSPPEFLALNSYEGDLLLKFGQREYMTMLHEEGLIRLGPASGYSDDSLNPAVRDDELSYESIAQPGAKLFVGPTGAEPPTIPIGGIHTIRMKSTLPNDYYVYCLTTGRSPRLFHDFHADACVVIHKPMEFTRRMEQAVARLLPGSGTGKGLVQYLDPHFDHPWEVDIPGSKHFRFSYQQEYRLAWFPSVGQQRLGPLNVAVGGLKDCSELITLS
jgi:hypothetical protein